MVIEKISASEVGSAREMAPSHVCLGKVSARADCVLKMGCNCTGGKPLFSMAAFRLWNSDHNTCRRDIGKGEDRFDCFRERCIQEGCRNLPVQGFWRRDARCGTGKEKKRI